MRYFVKPQAAPPQMYWDQPMQPLGHPTVYPSEPTNTGLLNQDGAPIFKGAEQIGFLHSHVSAATESNT